MIGKSTIQRLEETQGMRVEESLLHYRLTLRKDKVNLEQLKEWAESELTRKYTEKR